MAPILSKYLTRNALICGGLAATLWILKSQIHIKSSRTDINKNRQNGKEAIYRKTFETRTDNVKVHVNFEFLRQLLPIIKIVIPRWKSMEIFYVIFVTAMLAAKTFCDLLMVNGITSIESNIIISEKKLFMKGMLKLLISLPIVSTVNSLLKFAVGELKIRLRKNLSLHLYNDYLQKFTYYRVTNLDSRVSNADQILVADVDKLCDCLADLYCNVSKPLLDIALFTYHISTNVGLLTPGIIFLYFLVSGAFLTQLKKPMGQLVVMEQKLEGEFRHVNSRLITHAEEIAFYVGNIKEKQTLVANFTNLINHLRKLLHFRVLVGVVDNAVAKYLALVVGWFTYSIPFISGNFGIGAMKIDERSRIYYAAGFLVLKLAQTIGRLVLAGSELSRLAGLTVRITQFQSVLKDINNGVYQRTRVQQDVNQLQSNKGKLIFKNNVIKFDQVPVVTPNGDILIKELSISIHSGMNVLVCGPNGAGKSSIFRILGELWPLFGGKLTKPPSGKLFYVPQKPYMVLGSLRDQIIYPHSAAHAERRGYSDDQLGQYLKLVQLDYLLEREGGLDTLADWIDVLSGGEKQRIAMARLFYHSPQFAILDECTSAVAVDVENHMYSYCREIGITLLTVSHRKSLWKHHEYVLYLDGQGNYTFNAIQEDMEQFGS